MSGTSDETSFGLEKGDAMELLTRWIARDHFDDGIGAVMLNLYRSPVPDELALHVREIGQERFIAAGTLAAWAIDLPLPALEEVAT